jgi:ABC-type Fe3+-siderophore transport system permease subunit
MKKLIFSGGITIGIANTIWLFAEYFAGLHSIRNIDLFTKITPFAFLVPVIGLILIYLLLKRKQQLNIKYIKRVLKGIYITVGFSVVSVIGQLIYHLAINPSYFDTMIIYAKSKGEMNPEKYFNLSSYLFQILTGSLILGLVGSLILSIFIKNQGHQEIYQKS